MFRQDSDGDHMSLPRNPQQPKTWESSFDAAHYVAHHFSIFFCYSESFWKTLVQIHEKGGGVVLWEARPVYMHHLLQVRWLESP
jgi:hypothetical protein